jgi:hypothetical protein
VSRRLVPAALLALAATLAACGAQTSSVDEFKGTERSVAQTIEDLSEAGRDKDADRICKQLLAPELVQRLQERSRDCVRAIDSALDDADSFDLDVTDIRVTGDRAVARVESGTGKDDVDRLQLVRAGRGWRIASLG